MMVISYKQERYSDHMERWSAWKSAHIEVTSSIPSAAALLMSHADRRPGKKTARKPNNVTAAGKNSAFSLRMRPPQFGDTEKAIDMAMKWMRRAHPDIHRCVEAHFMHVGTSKEKSAAMKLTYDDYRRKMAEGKKMVGGFVAGLTARSQAIQSTE